MKKILYFLTALIVSCSTFFAQEQPEKESAEADTLRYQLDEVTVRGGFILEPKTINELEYQEIQKSDAMSLSSLGKFIPSVKVQTNSRGETLFYVRGTESRQLALYFDGILLNVPWDNRIDLSLIPGNVIGEVTVTKGIPSIVYGANAMAGVVSVTSDNKMNKSSLGKVKAEFGQNNHQKFTGMLSKRVENLSALLSVSYLKYDEYNLPDSYDSPGNPGDTRLNSYMESLNLFGKAELNLGRQSDIAASISYIDAEKGTPPETDVESPRYWQYPVWKHFSFALNGSYGISSETMLVYSLSLTDFQMEIEDYTDATYSTVDDIERGEDRTYYGRAILRHLLGQHSILKLAFNGYNSTHTESFQSGNYSELDYAQNVYSLGAEYEYIDDKYTAIVGVSLDGTSYPETGDKPDTETITDYSINTAFEYAINNIYSVQLSAGRKLRFPTLRESFSGALGRFLVNPDLGAETAYSGELSLNYNTHKADADFALFYTRMEDGIVRVSLPGGKLQRVNKDEIRTYGFEFSGDYRVNNNLLTGLDFTYLNSFAKNAEGEFSDTLEYKPEFMAGLFVDYTFAQNFNTVLELNYVGEEFGIREGSTHFRRLPDYLLANVRFAYYFNYIETVDLTAYVRVNNIFDKLYYTQWSLPEPGRQIWGGIEAEF